MRKLIALFLFVVLLVTFNAALAESWTCPECGKTDITSNFCPDCGTKKPEAKASSAGQTDIRAGDHVLFGHYETDNNEYNGTESIRWLVIETNGNNLFLLSEKGLDRHRFHARSDGTTWSDSELREWLNNTFLRKAFTSDEIQAIQVTTVKDNADTTFSKWNTKKRFSPDTQDRIFLLSYAEMNTLVSASDRFCEPSAAILKNVYTEKHNGMYCCWYWLRTSAFKNNAGVVDAGGKFETAYIHHEYGVVRPALWVDASAVTKD